MDGIRCAGGSDGARAARHDAARNRHGSDGARSYGDILQSFLWRDEDTSEGSHAEAAWDRRSDRGEAARRLAWERKQDEDRARVLRAEKKKLKRKLLKKLDELYYEKQRVIRKNDARVAVVRSARARHARAAASDLEDIPMKDVPASLLIALAKAGGAGR